MVAVSSVYHPFIIRLSSVYHPLVIAVGLLLVWVFVFRRWLMVGCKDLVFNMLIVFWGGDSVLLCAF